MKVIESSFKGIDVFSIKAGWLGLTIKRQSGWTASSYAEADIVEVNEVDAEKSRSVGKAAFGAIVGSVILPGAGTIVGAALGGRRRIDATFVIKFKDGNWLAFETSDKAVIGKLQEMIKKSSIRAEYGARDRATPRPAEAVDAAPNQISVSLSPAPAQPMTMPLYRID